MPGDLQNELAIPALVQQTTGCGSFHCQPAKDEWARRKTEVLPRVVALQAHTGHGLNLAHASL